MSELKIQITSHVTNGKLSRNRMALAEAITQWEGKDITITIERKRKQRSNQQNRYLHASLTILKNELNNLGNNFNMEEVKELVKAKFLMVDVVSCEGEIYGQRIKGTHECSTGEMLEFISQMRQWAYDVFNIDIPEPNSQISFCEAVEYK